MRQGVYNYGRHYRVVDKNDRWAIVYDCNVTGMPMIHCVISKETGDVARHCIKLVKEAFFLSTLWTSVLGLTVWHRQTITGTTSVKKCYGGLCEPPCVAYYKGRKRGPMDLELTFKGEELELVMEAVRAAVPCDDPLGEKIMLKYLTKRVEAQEAKEAAKKRIGFV